MSIEMENKIIKKRKLKIGRILVVFLFLILIVLGGYFFFQKSSFKISYRTKYLGNNTTLISLYDENYQDILSLPRGTKVQANLDEKEKKEDSIYVKVLYDNKKYFVLEKNLVDNEKDVIMEKELYVRTSATILADMDGKISSYAKKGEKVSIIGYDSYDEKGVVNAYKIKTDNAQGYIYGKYLVDNEEDALKNYEAETYDAIHEKIKNTYGGGVAVNLDFYPVEKPKFSDNPMPETVYALYLNNGTNIINNIDRYIEFAKDTKINAFVVDIKDNTTPGYDSSVMKNLSPTNYKHAINDFDKYKEAISKLKEAGFYVIGRITVFKDSYYVEDHPEDAMISPTTSKPYKYSGSYWPNPYDRDVWYFNVELAKEAIREFGFNEINFDYVRFTDRTQSLEKNNTIYFENPYKEDKASAIQGFLQYATDEIHKMHAYVSADVFGESTNGSYVTAYGQYWPAISNVVDVISAMPYPDHFADNSYGISKPWNKPYTLMTAWAKEAYKRQQETTTPALARTWVQAYNVMSHVDSNGITYGAEEVKAQIQALFEQKLTGGYITWLASSNLEKYKTQKAAFRVDYRSAY